jgi:hypothetical protein
MLVSAAKITCALLMCAAVVALTACASGSGQGAISPAPVSGEQPPLAVAPTASVQPAARVDSSPSAPREAARVEEPRGPKRISPEYVQRRMASNDPPLLVCGYGDDHKCSDIAIDGAITYNEFLSRLGQLPKGREIIFYCA